MADRGPGDRGHLRWAAAHVLVDAATLDAAPLVLGGETAHHLGRVLRLRPGESVTVADGAGRWRVTELAAAAGDEVELDPVGEVVQADRTGREVEIAVAIPKGDRADWLVQKCAEIGADRITLLHTDRSVVRWRGERVERQRARLQRIADEAFRQSRRLWRTVVAGPLESIDVLSRAVVAEPGGRSIGPGDDILAVGPEGGWTERELDLSGDRVDLGPSMLRTETAAVVALTLRVNFDH